MTGPPIMVRCRPRAQRGNNRGRFCEFCNSSFDGEAGRQAADARGLLARATGQRAYTIARQGTPELIAAHRADTVSDEAAYKIAQAAHDLANNTRTGE